MNDHMKFNHLSDLQFINAYKQTYSELSAKHEPTYQILLLSLTILSIPDMLKELTLTCLIYNQINKELRKREVRIYMTIP